MTGNHNHKNAADTLQAIHDLTVQIRNIVGTHTLMVGGPNVVRALRGPTISKSQLKQVQAIASQLELIICNPVSVTWGKDVRDPNILVDPLWGPQPISATTTQQPSPSPRPSPSPSPLPSTCPICEPQEYVA